MVHDYIDSWCLPSLLLYWENIEHIFFAKTTRPRALIFGTQHHLIRLWDKKRTHTARSHVQYRTLEGTLIEIFVYDYTRRSALIFVMQKAPISLDCDNWRQTSRVGRKAVSKQSPVIRNFLACVAKWRKVVAKNLNMFKNFMRQNSSQNGRKVIAGVSKPSRTCRRPLAI